MIIYNNSKNKNIMQDYALGVIGGRETSYVG